MNYFRLTFFSFCLSIYACGFPKNYNVDSDPFYSQYKCVKSTHPMYVDRIINFCPMFSDKPEAGSWSLNSLRNATNEQIESIKTLSASTRWSMDKKHCYNPLSQQSSQFTAYRILPIGTAFRIREVATMWDFENGTRTYYNGTLQLDGEEIEFFASAYITNDLMQFFKTNFEPCNTQFPN